MRNENRKISIRGKNMFCEKCGKEIADNAMFCPYCGQQLNGYNING